MDEVNSDNSRSSVDQPPSPDSDESPERPWAGRLRGRGRARGRGTRQRAPRRGRGRGRGRAARIEDVPNREEIAAETREERDRQLKDRISHLDDDRKNELLFKACDRDPSFSLEIVNEVSQQARRSGQGHHPSPDDEKPSWCICNKCREMPTEVEKVCCEQTPDNCFSTLPDFHLIATDNLVLAMNDRYRQDIFGYAADDDQNRGRRHAAYRHYILWQYGYLGAGNRRVVPSCCVWKIRDKFPDNFGQYRGFEGGRLG